MTGVVSESGVTTVSGFRAIWVWGIVRGVDSWDREGKGGVDRRYAGGGDGRGGCSAATGEAIMNRGNMLRSRCELHTIQRVCREFMLQFQIPACSDRRRNETGDPN